MTTRRRAFEEGQALEELKRKEGGEQDAKLKKELEAAQGAALADFGTHPGNVADLKPETPERPPVMGGLVKVSRGWPRNEGQPVHDWRTKQNRGDAPQVMRMRQMKPFLQTLLDIGQGQVVDDAEKLLRQAREQVSKTKGKASITVTLTVSPEDMSRTGEVLSYKLTGGTAAKMPAGEKRSSILYPSEGGGFQNRDPRQPELPKMTPPMPEAEEADDDDADMASQG